MYPENPEPGNKKFRALVAPLDWGTGHATRCIPVINELINTGADVILGLSGKSGIYLKNRFPGLETVTLPSAPIHYNGSNVFCGLIKQLPRFLLFARKEYFHLKHVLAHSHIDVIISDNRYGLHNKKVYTIIITHQLFIRLPRRFGLLSGLIWRITGSMLSKFDECWIPDMPDSTASLGSALSHGHIRLKNYRYIGLVSRLHNFRKHPAEGRSVSCDLLVILSGPEPQRTILEKILIQQIRNLNIKSIILRGLPDRKNRVKTEGCITLMDNPDDSTFGLTVSNAQKIICRPGYSTIMDLVALQRNALLVPTPGQTEQEYLARSLTEKKLFFFLPQQSFQLPLALDQLKSSPVPDFEGLITDLSLLKQSLSDLINKINKQ